MLKDIGHPFAQGEPQYDVTFENVQAGERTSHLFRLANLHGGIVVGTGDLCELALGWCTYGVGDHMSHYNVNASVPKTLIQYLVRWVASHEALGDEGSAVLRAPRDRDQPGADPGCAGSRRGASQPGQRTEESIGPYELQDFHLYYMLRFGFAPTKVAFLAHAWRDRARGRWPDELQTAAQRVRAGRDQAPPRHLPVALLPDQPVQAQRVPNAPKVGSGGSLSPRGDWRAPSDSEAEVWLEDLKRVPAP